MCEKIKAPKRGRNERDKVTRTVIKTTLKVTVYDSRDGSLTVVDEEIVSRKPWTDEQLKFGINKRLPEHLTAVFVRKEKEEEMRYAMSIEDFVLNAVRVI